MKVDGLTRITGLSSLMGLSLLGCWLTLEGGGVALQGCCWLTLEDGDFGLNALDLAT